MERPIFRPCTATNTAARGIQDTPIPTLAPLRVITNATACIGSKLTEEDFLRPQRHGKRLILGKYDGTISEQGTSVSYSGYDYTACHKALAMTPKNFYPFFFGFFFLVPTYMAGDEEEQTHARL